MPGLLDGMHSRSVSPETLSSLAKTASNRYLAEQAPLNDSIRKLASEYGLNSHQIARVCEMANQQTHQALWKTATEKEKVAFDVANPAKITVVSVGSAPQSSPSADFSGPPSGMPAAGPSMAQLMGVNPDGGHNGLGQATEKQQLVVILQKTAAEQQQVSDDMVLLAARHETEEKNLFHMVKQAVFGEGLSLEALYAGACQMGYGEIAKEYFPKMAEQLHRDTARAVFTKIAWKAPEELIDYDVPVTVVNGRHPVMISLDTLLRYRDQEQKFNWHLARINDRNHITSQRIRELQ